MKVNIGTWEYQKWSLIIKKTYFFHPSLEIWLLNNFAQIYINFKALLFNRLQIYFFSKLLKLRLSESFAFKF